MSWSATISSSSPSSGVSFCRFSRVPRYSSGGDGPAGQLDRLVLGAEQGLDGGVEGEGQRGELGGGKGALAALGLVDGLPAPGLAQVAAESLAEVGPSSCRCARRRATCGRWLLRPASKPPDCHSWR